MTDRTKRVPVPDSARPPWPKVSQQARRSTHVQHIMRTRSKHRDKDLLTAESVRMVAMGDLMFFRSHTLTVRSSLPDTTLSPTVNTADVTVLRTHTGHASVAVVVL